MGEIIFSFVIGGCLVLSGTILIVASNRESKRELKRMADSAPDRQSEQTG